MSDNPYRLPRHVQPSHYDIRLDLDIDNFTFTGSVGIDIGVNESVDELILNCAEIDITVAAIVDGPEVTAISYDDDKEMATLSLSEALAPGSYRVEMQHSGSINDQLRGLYRAFYKDADGNEHPIATSQCQSTDARRVFPCWDEPDFKATYQTTMVVADGLEAYSNAAELERVDLGDGRVEFRFGKTMKMSTYLLAFIAGPFEATEPQVAKGTPIRIIVPKGNLHLTDIAMENAIFTFEYLSDYYGIPYPGDKLDHIAIPDFAAGAMENVGLITYRDTYLVIDPEKASQGELQNSVDVIGHEVAHQWFGNLVTMGWWEGAWLNEAFASFMEMKATVAMRPEWKRWLTFMNLYVPWAMGTDQLKSTRPIEFEVVEPSEVDQMFDAITYGKGSAVLHMLDEFMGVENFREGVGNYLRKHSYSNTVTADLWEGLDGASDYPVSEIMNTWVYQRGFPQVDVKKVDGGIELAQRRYLAIPDETDTTIWKVPVQLRGSVNGERFHRKFLLETDEATVEIDGSIDWMTANAGGYGFYRTRYEERLFESLMEHVDDLGDEERYALVADTFGFLLNGQVSADAFLDLVSHFQDENEHAIWSVIVGGLGAIEHHVLDDAVRDEFEATVRDLVGPALDRMGWEPKSEDTDLDRKLRGLLVGAMGNLGNDTETIGKASGLAKSVLAGESVDPEIGTAALGVYARNGGSEAFEELWDAYQGASAPLDQARYLRSVASTGDESSAQTMLDNVIAGDVRTQDAFWVFALLIRGKSGPTVWEHARGRWDDVLATMPGMTRTRVAEGISALSQPEVAASVRSHFAEHPVPEASQSIEQNLEKLDINIALREREAVRVTAYFSL